MTSSERTEAQTRTALIDSQLARSGWSRERRTLPEEFLITKTAESEPDYGNEQFADYVLLGTDGRLIAVVEAKRSSPDELAGKRQAADYAEATREFKAEHAKQRDTLRGREQKRIQQGQLRHTLAEGQAYVTQWRSDQVPSEPHHEVHSTLCAALLQPASLAAWHTELELVR